jgi:transposase
MNNTIAYKLGQLPDNALYVGIDPHKHQHTVSISTTQAQVLSKFKIGNDLHGFEELLERGEQFRRRAEASCLVFAIEPGAHYWRNLAYFLEGHQETVRLVNPFTLKRQRDGDDLMRRKNDYRDATMAADLLRQGKYTWTRLPKQQYAELRTAHDTYQQLVQDESRLRVQLTTALDGLFPEFRQVFKALDGQTALAVLCICPIPAVIAQLELAGFVELVRSQHARPRLMVKKLARLHSLASRSVGVPCGTGALALRVQSLAERLVFVKAHRQQAQAHLVALFDRCAESRFLRSVYGLGAINAAGILAHIGDISQYSTVKQLPKLAGVVPIESSSATHSASNTPMSKKGRNGLRAVTYRAVIALLRHNQAFADHVKKLQQRPAGHNPLTKREAIGATMNKLLRIVYALLSKQRTFDPALAFAT